MRVLLLAMPNSIWAFDLYARLPNLGITSLAGNVDDEHEVNVADLVLVRRNFQRFLETQITKHAPDIVGLSSMSYQVKAAKYIANYIKHIDRKIQVVLGGYHATVSEDLDHLWGPNLDFIIRGEGETTFNELLRSLDTGNPKLKEIKNLSFKKNSSFSHNPRAELLDLSTLQRPNRSVRLLKTGFHAFGLKADVVESSRGCLYNCKFCSIREMYGRSYRKFPLVRTLKDIDSCIHNKVKSITFTDDNVALDISHLNKLCDGIIDQGLNDIHFSVQLGVKPLYDNPQILKKLVEANFKFIFLGIENTNPKNLRLYGKTVKQMAMKAKTIVSYLRQHGIIVMGGFIIGNPDDTKSDFYDVLTYAKRIKVDLAAFSALQPYPKTKIREILLKRQLIFNKDDFSRYDGVTLNAKTTHLSRKEVEILREELWSQFYDFNWLIWNNLRKVYPLYFARTLIRFTPRFLKYAFYDVTKRKTAYEIAQDILQSEKEFRNLKK